MTFVDGIRLLVVMIGAKASGADTVFTMMWEVARYPFNSMDFIEFNG